MSLSASTYTASRTISAGSKNLLSNGNIGERAGENSNQFSGISYELSQDDLIIDNMSSSNSNAMDSLNKSFGIQNIDPILL